MSLLQPRKPSPPALPDVRLEGFRVILRPPRNEDGAQWLAVRRRNRAFLEPFEPSWASDCLTPDYFLRRQERLAAAWHGDEMKAFLIFRKEDGVLIGGVNVNNIARGAAQFASLGYWLDESSQGQGYMAEALRLAIGYAFRELKLHRLNAGCLPHNARSRKVLRKLGFKEEGYAEKYLQIAGEWQDHILYGLNAEDWH